MEELRTFQPKNNSKSINSAPALSRTSLLNNTTQTMGVMQTFDDDQTPLISWISITKSSMK